jgi:hypothetical protein
MLAVTDTGTGMDPETPSETICALSGIQFDPRLVAAFVSIPEKTWPATATNQQRVAKHHPQFSSNSKMELRNSCGLVFPQPYFFKYNRNEPTQPTLQEVFF